MNGTVTAPRGDVQDPQVPDRGPVGPAGPVGVERSGRLALVAAELGVLCLAMGTAAGFNRLFLGWSFLSRLAPLVVGAWAAALVLRRARVPVRYALPLHTALGVVALTVVFAPGTHVVGLPTGHTLEVLSREVDSSFAAFSRLVAPVPVSTGFLVVIAAALWLFAFFADTAALRYRGVVQAAVPHSAAFLAIGVLARESGRTSSARWFAAGLAAYALSQVARLAWERRWVRGQQRRGARAVVAQAAVVAVLAVALGAVLGPLMPGGTAPVVDLRELGRGDGPRTVVSPFVGIRSLLGPRSDEVVFTVESTEPAYWRLTALEQFDVERGIWVSSGTYSGAREQLPRTPSAEVGGRTLRQQFRIEGLGGLWLPGAYVPERIRSDHAVSFDARSASIIRGDDDQPDELDYTLESRVPDFSSLQRRASTGRVDARIDETHLEVPELSPEVQSAIAEAVDREPRPYQRMLLLQDWFRSEFAYDETVDYSNELDPLEAFLSDRRGFCQQFSSAFALIARSLGLPSRVAVGFTQGDAGPALDDGSDPDALTQGTSRFVVRGRHAHAWPEVHFPGVGWVPFEPTPGRGDPQSTSHTGVGPAQAPPPDDATTTTTTTAEGGEQSPTTTQAPPTTDAAPGAGEQEPDGTADRAAPSGSATRSWVVVGLVLLAAVLAGSGAVVLLRRRSGASGTARRTDRRAEVASAWRDATRALARLGIVAAPSDTPMEFAARAGATLAERTPATPDRHADAPAVEVQVVDALRQLATIETRARYGPGEIDDRSGEAARRAASVVVDYSSSERRNRSRAREPALLK